MRPTLPILATLAVLLLPGSASPAAAPSADMSAFLAAVSRAYGGRSALDSVRAYRLEGSVYSAMRHTEARTVRIWARPDRFKALVNYEQHPEGRVADGSDVWRNEPGGPLEPATGPMRAAVLLQAARAGVPWTLLAHAADARFLRDEPPPIPVKIQVDGAPVRLIAIEVPLGEGLRLRAWADSLGRIRVSQGLMEGGAVHTHFETFYDDFRPSAGVSFAYRELNWASGSQTGITTVERVTVNPPLRPDEFLPPAAGDNARARRGER